MSDNGPDVGNIIAGVFLILFGLCFLLVGGGCTILWISLLSSSSAGSGLGSASGLVLLSLAAAAGGIAMIVVGIRMFRPRR